MVPILFDLSDRFKIYSFGTFIVLAFLVASFYVRHRAAKTLDVEKPDSFNLCFAMLFIGLAGARLAYAVVHYDEFSAGKMKIFKLWEGGLVWYGGLFAVLAYLAWYLPRQPRFKGWAMMDVLALGGCLAIFVGRWASFLSGENYGKVAPDLPWAVTFPHVDGSQAKPLGVPLHPTQLYHSLHGLLLFGLLVWYMRRKPEAGQATGLFLMLYAVGRSIIEIWRGDDAARGMLIDGYVSTSQLLSVPVFFLGVAIFLARKARTQEYA
ncbi:MAG: prolipoprotein diacylglyceryl transferase [Planctomycetota bacterium]|nr:prolipoprotein diacylglyceryl transferase [Planctomycetota bacterium]